YKGFHTVELDSPLSVAYGDDFFVYVYLSAGGQPYDCTSDVPVLLGSSGRVMVNSAAGAGESYYYDGGNWLDLTTVDSSANFCIKALSNDQPPIHFDYPEPLPAGPNPPGPATEIVVEITDGFETYVPGSALMHYRFDANDPYTEVALTSLGNDLFSGELPHTRPGDEPQFYFSAEGDGGNTYYSPIGAPATVFSFDVCFVETLFEDQFETQLDWTVQNTSVSTGEWERADPAGTDAQPENDHTDLGTHCYVTGKNGGSIGDDDLDGGPTRLISPVFDLSGGDALIRFYAWFYHTDYGVQHPLQVEMENGNGVWVDVMDLTHNPAWNLYSFRASDYIALSDTMKIRFTANDNPNDDVVEALIDDLVIDRFVYDASLWADGYSISVSSRAVIDISLDTGAGNSNRPYLLLGSLSGTSPGFLLPGGAVLPLNWDLFTDLLLNFLNTQVCQNFYSTLDGAGAGQATLDTIGSLDPSLIGETAHFAFLLGAPPYMNYTSNAIAISFVP
ncbi:MAG: lectin like domain-containing protein, partial [Planctomycetota bacterium]